MCGDSLYNDVCVYVCVYRTAECTMISAQSRWCEVGCENMKAQGGCATLCQAEYVECVGGQPTVQSKGINQTWILPWLWLHGFQLLS